VHTKLPTNTHERELTSIFNGLDHLERTRTMRPVSVDHRID
jgi:hypothetical protein